MRGILDFYSPIPSAGFDVPAQEAIDQFQAKGLKPSFAWQDVMRDEHKTAFTVAKMMDVDMLSDVKKSLDDALANGVVFRDWADNMIPMLQQKGWWGRKAVLDPLTGETIIAQLGSPARLQNIFRTNMQSAYAAGHWDQIEAQAEDAPYLMYDAVDDYRTRTEHKAWDNIVRPITDTFWKFHTPPCGWNCRCSVIQLDDADLEQLGMEVSKAPATKYEDWTNPRTGKTIKVPQGVDPGFGHAAASRIDKLKKLLNEKVAALPDPLEQAAKKAVADMEKALAEKTPYLSTAIKSIQAKNPELGPVDMLNEAKAKAAKAKQSSWLSEYKKAILSGKKIPDNAQSAFDSLPQEAQQAFLKDIEQQSALLKANAAATAKLDEFKAATPTSAQGKALAALQKAGELDGVSVIEQTAKLEAKLVEVKAIANTSSMLSNYKKNVLAGKIPSEQQKAAFDSLPDTEKQAFLAKIDKEKAKLAPPPPAPEPDGPLIDEGAKPVAPLSADTIDGSAFTQIGPQKGSNPGGLFQDTETGEKWYVKWPESMEQARNEVLTAKLYDLSGIDVPDYRFTVVDGKEGIASRWIDGLDKNKAGLAKAEGALEGFAMDAWLANWDVIGANFDNMLVKGKKAFRVDTGGGLLYRAQGGAKGTAFGDTVDELDSLRDARTNSQAASVFGKLTDKQIEDSVRRVLVIRDADIERLVEQYGPRDVTKRVDLAARLIARKQDMWERYPNARPDADLKPAPIPEASATVTMAEQKIIEEARSNGYAIRTDKDQIEDHNVTLSVFQTSGGGNLTRAHMKLTTIAGQRIEKDIAKKAGEAAAVVTGSEPLRAEILQLIKGVNSRALKGEAFDQKNIDRWKALEPKILDHLQKLVTASIMKGVDEKLIQLQDDYLREWYTKLRSTMNSATATGKAVKIDGMFQADKITDILQKQEIESGGGIQWQRQNSLQNRITEIKRGYATLTTNTQDVPGIDRVYTAEIDGARITYVPFEGNSDGRAFQGTVMIDVDGAGAGISAKTVEALEKLGINAKRATDDDRLELYLNKHARLYTIKNGSRKDLYEASESIADQKQRLDKKLSMINSWVGRDISKSDQFGSYTGRYQAFGHGRPMQYRADLDDDEFNKFAKSYVVYNNPTGLGSDAHGSYMLENVKSIIESGGMYVSRADMVRRGIPMRSGTSVSSDIRTGCGNYIFTRIKSKRSTGAGIYWKPTVMRRADAISYSGDNFGSTHDNTLQYRKTQINEWQEIAGNSSNETIFKDGLSMFDDVDRVVFPNASQAEDLIRFMKDHGYAEWPDGRKLEDVITYKGRSKA